MNESPLVPNEPTGITRTSREDSRPNIRRGRYSWDLVTHLVAREFRLRYREAFLGWLWAVGSPLARLVVLTFVFTKVLPLGIPNYSVFVFTGIIAWSWFSAGVGSATTSAVDRRDLLFRPGVPRGAVPVVSALTDGLDYIAALPVLAVFMLLGDGIPPTALLLPVVLSVQLLLMLGLGFALCAANVYLRDVHLFVNVIMMLGWYATPIFYEAKAVPESFVWVFQLNPMAHLLDAYRAILVRGEVLELGPFLVLTGACAAIFVAGGALYKATSPLFVDEL